VTSRPRHLVPPHGRAAAPRLGWSLFAGALIGVEKLSRVPLLAVAGAWIGACVFSCTVPLGFLLDSSSPAPATDDWTALLLESI